MPPIELVELAENFSCYALSTEGAMIELKAIYTEMFEEECYLKRGLTLPDEGCVLDVGANAGMFSLYAHDRAPKTRVLAFEPMPVNLEILRRNLDLHNATNVEVLPIALGSAEGSASFTFYPNLPGNSTRFPELKKYDRDSISEQYGEAVGDLLYSGETVTVPVERLSSVLTRYPDVQQIDLLKVDVEGAELDVLEGIDAADWPRIRQVAIELQDLGTLLADVTGLLRARGFRVDTEMPPSLAHLNYHVLYASRD